MTMVTQELAKLTLAICPDCGKRFTGSDAESLYDTHMNQHHRPRSFYPVDVNSEAPITPDEMYFLFGSVNPNVVFPLVFDSPGDWTIGKLRSETRKLAVSLRLELGV